MSVMIREGLTIFSLTGWRDCGKTHLLCELIRRLPGKCAACITSDYPLYQTDTDASARLRQAGADHVFRLEQPIISRLTSSDGLTDTEGVLSFLPGSLPADFLLFEGMLLSGTVTAVLYTRETAVRGICPGHDHAGVLIHDGRAETLALLDSHRNREQLLLFRRDYPEMLELLLS